MSFMSPSFAPSPEQLIRKLGIQNFSQHLEQRFDQARDLALRAGTPLGCHLQETGISPSAALPTQLSTVLVIDIGGTNTKVSFREVDSEDDVTLELLFAEENHHFDVPPVTHSFRRYLSNLFARIKEHLPAIQELNSVALVWSYAMAATQAPESLMGNGAKVADRPSYDKKKNFFNEDLKEGDDLGAMVLEGIKGSFSTRGLIIANDTVFTMNAASGANAGVVCSTGANGTLLRPGPDGTVKIFNSESGGQYIVPLDSLSDAEREYFLREQKPAHLEMLCAGKHMGHLFERNVVDYVVASKNGSLDSLHKLLEERLTKKAITFSPSGVGLLANKQFDEFLALQRESIYPMVANYSFTKPELTALHNVARAMHERAGQAAAVLCYLSIVDQFTDKKETFRIAFDSTIGTSSPVFFDSLNKTLQGRVAPYQVEIELLKQKDGISVPSLGGFRSVDEVLQNG
jgi:hexokinase